MGGDFRQHFIFRDTNSLKTPLFLYNNMVELRVKTIYDYQTHTSKAAPTEVFERPPFHFRNAYDC